MRSGISVVDKDGLETVLVDGSPGNPGTFAEFNQVAWIDNRTIAYLRRDFRVITPPSTEWNVYVTGQPHLFFEFFDAVLCGFRSRWRLDVPDTPMLPNFNAQVAVTNFPIAVDSFKFHEVCCGALASSAMLP